MNIEGRNSEIQELYNKMVNLVSEPKHTITLYWQELLSGSRIFLSSVIQQHTLLTVKCVAYKTEEHFLTADSTHGYETQGYFVSHVPRQLSPNGWKAFDVIGYRVYGVRSTVVLWSMIQVVLQYCLHYCLKKYFQRDYLFYYLKPESIFFHFSSPSL